MDVVYAGVPMSDEVPTVKDAAALLKVAEKTVDAMVQAAEIPPVRIRNQWHIKRTEPDISIGAQPHAVYGGDRDE
jgi:excisionase family DNA binding protein